MQQRKITDDLEALLLVLPPTIEQALRIADNALYLAKLQGRNRIVFHSLFGDGDI